MSSKINYEQSKNINNTAIASKTSNAFSLQRVAGPIEEPFVECPAFLQPGPARPADPPSL